MQRSSLLLIAALAVSACSGSDDAVPTTVAPPATGADPVTTEPTTTVSTTTGTTGSTTTTIATTTTEPPDTTQPPATEASETSVAPNADEQIVRDAFDGYESAWAARRAAIVEPENEDLRAALLPLYVAGPNLDNIIAFLDGIVSTPERTIPDDELPSSVTLLGGSVIADSVKALIFTCEVLTGTVINTETDEVVAEPPHAYLNQVFMDLEDGVWKISSESFDADFPEQTTCE